MGSGEATSAGGCDEVVRPYAYYDRTCIVGEGPECSCGLKRECIVNRSLMYALVLCGQ